MIKTLKTLLGDAMSEARPAAEDPQQALRLACTVLMFEVLRADMKTAPGELETMRRHVMRAYGLDDAEAERLLERSSRESAERVSMHDLVRAINHEYDAGQKRELVKALWDVAYADGALDPHEEHTIRKLADWLHVPHRHFIQTKHEAAAARAE